MESSSAFGYYAPHPTVPGAVQFVPYRVFYAPPPAINPWMAKPAPLPPRWQCNTGPPKFEKEADERAKARKQRAAARKALGRAATLMKCEWARPIEYQMGAKPIEKMEPEERVVISGGDFFRPKIQTLEERCTYATKMGFRTMRIAGIVVPNINGYFYMYLPKLGEMRKQWRQRLFRMRKLDNFGKAQKKLQEDLELPLFEQIRRNAQRLGSLQNRFSKLPVAGKSVFLTDADLCLPACCTVSAIPCTCYKPPLRTWAKISKPKVFGPKNFGNRWEEKMLARKIKLALFAQEWREARALRKEKLNRVILRLGNHQVKSMKSELETLAMKFVKENIQNFKLNEPQGEMFSLFKSADKVSDTIEKVDKITDAIDDNLIKDIKDTSSNMSEISKGLKGFFSGGSSFIEGVQSKLQKWVSLIINAITNLCHVLLNFNLKSLGLAIISFLVQLKALSFSFTELIVTKLKSLFSCLTRDKSSKPIVDLSPVGEMAGTEDDIQKEKDSKICSYVSTLVAAVAAMFAFVPKFCKSRYDELGSLLMSGISKFAFTANHLYTFVKNNLVCIKQAGEWLFSDHPSIKKLGFLKAHDDIYEWASAVLEYTDPRKENEVFTSPRKASQAYILAGQASVLQIKMLDLNLTNSQSTIMNNLIKKIHDLRDRLSKTHTAPPVRFEPYVYELTGRTGIGKSELLKVLPYALFEAMGFKHEGELIYHRAIGNAYWNNLRNQPVCTIDEKFPIDAPGFSDVQLAELFQLKSSCVFNPPMADIPDKNIRYNPIIVQGSSNDPFPDLAGVKDKSALFRRRDELIRVQVKESIRIDCGADATYSQIRSMGKLVKGEEFGHLEFLFHRDPKNGLDDNNQWEGPMNYKDFLSRLIRGFKIFFKEEERKFRREINRMATILPDEGSDSTLKQLFDYKWLEDREKQNPNFNQKDKEFHENYKLIVKTYSQKRDIFHLKLRILFLEMFSPSSVDEIRELANRCHALEFPTLKVAINPLEEKLGSLKEAVKDLKESQKQLHNTLDGTTADVKANLELSQKAIEQKQELLKIVQDSRIKADLLHEIDVAKSGQEVIANFALKTAEANGDPNSIIRCCHKILLDSLTYNKVHYVYKRSENSWDVNCENQSVWDSIYEAMDLNFQSAQQIDMIKALVDKDCFNYDDKLQKITIRHAPCKSSKCLFNTKELRNQFVKEFLNLRQDVAKKLTMGMDCTELLPLEFVQGIYTIPKEILKEHDKLKDQLPEIKSYWAKFKESFYNIKWVKWLKKLAIAISIFSFIGALVGLWNYYSGDKSSEVLKDVAVGSTIGVNGAIAASKLGADSNYTKLCDEVKNIIAEGHVSGDYKVHKHSKSHSSPAVKSVSALSTRAEGVSGVLGEEIVNEKLARNTFFMDIASDLGPKNPGRCLGICGHYAIVVDHYMDAWKYTTSRIGDTRMMFIPVVDTRCSVIEFSLSELEYYRIENSALGIIKLPKRIPNFKDIRKMICPKNSHNILNRSGTMAEMILSRNDYITLNKANINFEQYDDTIFVPGCELWKDFKIFNAYEYEGFSGRGRCGSVLLGHGVQSPIIGIHVAGYPSTNTGISDVIYREMFDHLGIQPNPVSVMGEGKLSQWFVDANVIGMGKVPAQYAHQERGQSRIVPSKVQQCDKGRDFKIYTQPAVLSDHDPRLSEKFSPMIEGCKHHGLPLIPFNSEDIKLAKEDLLNLILSKCIPQRQKVGLLTIDEAIGGFDGKLGYEHLNFNTSEGFPFTGLRPKGFSNKKWLFNFNEDNKYVSCNKILLDVLKIKWQQRLLNQIPATVFVDCLKDCTIPHEKVLVKGKTRIFSMSSVDFTIQQRQCTLDFVVAYMTNRLKLEHMIGCNPDSIEWTLLSRKLLEKGQSILTGDYSKYGDSLPFEFIEAAFEIISEWYRFNGCDNQELFQQLKIMPFEIGHSIHLMFDHLYQMVCGQPSGNSLTVIVNSIANSLYMRVAYLSIMRNTEFNSLKDMHSNIQIYSYGDDLIVSLSDNVKDIFNAKSLHEFFGNHLLKFTNADKSDQIVPYCDIYSAEFLKRKFMLHPSRISPRIMLAPLAEASIEDTVNWVWKDSFQRDDPECPTFIEMSIQVCEDSLRNAFGRGEAYYNAWRIKLVKFWQKRGINFIADEWKHMDYKIFNLSLDLSPYHKFQFKPQLVQGEMAGRDASTQTNPWSMPNSPVAVRNSFPQNSLVRISREDQQGFGPHDWHWVPASRLRASRSLEFLRDINDNNQLTPNRNLQGQMANSEGDAQGEVAAKVDKKSNVEMQSQVGASVATALPGGAVKNSYAELSAAESVVSDRTFHDRWYTIKSFMWTGADNEGKIVCEMDLPKDILEDEKFKKSPNYTAFAKHMYNSFKILRMKIVANCNVRQYGQLQWSFYYGSKQDYHFDYLRKDRYVASQRLHALLTANTSNEVVIEIPFEYIFPMMAINRVSQKGYKSLGTLLGIVMVPLTAIQGCPQEASIKILCSFEGNRFAGMVSQSLAEANMLGLASIIAVKSLLDKNRDSPTVVTPGTPVIPINSSSWCHGTGQATYNNVLRLNPNKVLPYEEGRIPSIDEMKIEHVKRQFGLVYVGNWISSRPPGFLLGKWDAEPLHDINEYYHFKYQEKDVHVVPPIGVLSSMFAYWRGSLEYRIDIVGAKELSGSLLIGYVPRYTTDDYSKITMEDLYSCPHAIYDIHDNRQFVFKVPYVASHMFWPRRNTLSVRYPTYEAPGAVFMFVYNKLIVNCTIPDNCKLLTYVRGGEDFEVAIPASPSLGLSYNPNIYVPSSVNKRIVPIEGYTPSYSGSWRYALVRGDYDDVNFYAMTFASFNAGRHLKSSTNYYVPVARYNSYSDHITLLRAVHFTLKPYTIYLCEIKGNIKGYYNYVIDGGVPTKRSVNLMLVSGDDDYTYGRPISNEYKDDCIKLLKWIYETSPESDRKKYNVDMVWLAAHAQDDNLDLGSANYFDTKSEEYWTPSDYYLTLIYPEDPSAEAGEEAQVEAPIAEPQKTAKSSVSDAVFGEQFLDLKDLCRRFQLYASNNLTIPKLLQASTWRSIVIRFPVVPQGLDLDLGSSASPNEYWNRTRDGPIPLVASGYRFFTGGIRFRVCLNIQKSGSLGGAELRGKIFVQHRPNIINTAKTVLVQSGVTLGTDDLELPGYAAYHQFEDLNNVLSIEVPFYQPSLRTYLQRPSDVDLAQRFSDLGELVVGVTVFHFESLRFNYDIYYSLADDARFSVFTGFPPVIDISKIKELDPPSFFATIVGEQALDEEALLVKQYTEIIPKFKELFDITLDLETFKNDSISIKRMIIKNKLDDIKRQEAINQGFNIIEKSEVRK